MVGYLSRQWSHELHDIADELLLFVIDDKDEGDKTVAKMANSAMKKDRNAAFKI